VGQESLIGLLDPSLDTKNQGDHIISEAVSRELADLGLADVVRLPTQRTLTRHERHLAAACDRLVVGGTNLLSSNMPWYRQWKISPAEIKLYRGKTLLLGVGWWQYQGPPNAFTQRVLGAVLAADVRHSLRDSWTLRQFKSLGREGLNTSCPTMWRLPAQPEVSQSRRGRVLVTLTDYNRDSAADGRLIQLLAELYDEVLLWPQGARDADYVSQHYPGVKIIASSLFAFDVALEDGDADYVGTRLHAGIRALQRGVRATVIAVDNRATEIARDTGLPVVSRALTPADRDYIANERLLQLNLPYAEIVEWKAQASSWLCG
jgi:polysaccharide pyruvyl transferase WcaK-like protein